MKIAIIGSGISGMVAAHHLAGEHDITLFEAGKSLGGHTATIDVESKGKSYAIDTGFIVYNDWTYPQFIRLLKNLGVETKPTAMSFSVSDALSGVEYAGSSLNTLFAQRRNIVSPRFLRMTKDILKFNSQVETHLSDNPECGEMTLGDYLDNFKYSKGFADLYLIPMGAAIWSANTEMMLNFPLAFFVRFFRNHGLLNVRNRPQWRVIKGGSRSYIDPLSKAFKQNVELENPVTSVTRVTQSNGRPGVRVQSKRCSDEYDEIIFACHSDQALKILQDKSAQEDDILSAIPYTSNEVVLHTDSSLLPKNRNCWSSWNVALGSNQIDRPTLTYNMNILQGLAAEETFCVTLNQTNAIAEEKVVGIYHYDHPVFSEQGIKAQSRWSEINGIKNTWFCGAYWRNGFHEDGVWSALRVINELTKKMSIEIPKIHSWIDAENSERVVLL
jgi:predicted NAD/FAD-binding protein